MKGTSGKFLALVLVATFSASSALAQPGGGMGAGPGSGRGPGGGPGGGMGGGIMRSLNLTDAQRGQMMGRRLEREKMWKQAQEAMAEKDKLRALMQDPKSEESAMRAQLKRALDAQAKFHEMRINNLLAIRRILTPDQLKEMFSRIDEMRGARGGCGGGMKGGMRGGPGGGGGFGPGSRGNGPGSRMQRPPPDADERMLDGLDEAPELE